MHAAMLEVRGIARTAGCRRQRVRRSDVTSIDLARILFYAFSGVNWLMKAPGTELLYLDTHGTSRAFSRRHLRGLARSRSIPKARASTASSIESISSRSQRVNAVPSSTRCQSARRPGSAKFCRIPPSRSCFTTPITTCDFCTRITAGTSTTSSTPALPPSCSASSHSDLAALLEQFFGVKLDKKHQRADWSLRPLTPGNARLCRAGHAPPARSAR